MICSLYATRYYVLKSEGNVLTVDQEAWKGNEKVLKDNEEVLKSNEEKYLWAMRRS